MSKSPSRIVRKLVAGTVVALCSFGQIAQAEPILGRVALAPEIAAWDIDVRPDGFGLPDGKGNVAQGEGLFDEMCAACHGDFAEGLGLYPSLAGDGVGLTSDDPVKSIGAFVPYLSTVFDFIQRAKPFGDSQTLTPDEIYAILAYLLHLNDLVDDNFELSEANFAGVSLPNSGGFFDDDRLEAELPIFEKTPCMAECKSNVDITSRAITGITPN